MRSKIAILIYMALVLAGLFSAATYFFTFKTELNVLRNDVSVTPKTHTFSATAGSHHVEQINITNTGKAKDIYFEVTVEGPSPDKIDVSFHRQNGTPITSSNRLHLENGTATPYSVLVNVHFEIDEDAEEGKYTVYIDAKVT